MNRLAQCSSVTATATRHSSPAHTPDPTKQLPDQAHLFSEYSPPLLKRLVTTQNTKTCPIIPSYRAVPLPCPQHRHYRANDQQSSIRHERSEPAKGGIATSKLPPKPRFPGTVRSFPSPRCIDHTGRQVRLLGGSPFPCEAFRLHYFPC